MILLVVSKCLLSAGFADLEKQSVISMRYLILSLLAAGLVFGAVTLLLLKKVVLRRLARLSADVSDIGRSGDFACRVSVAGRDELSALADQINQMLSSFERSHYKPDLAEEKKMAAEIARLERLNLIGEMAAGIGHEVRNPMTTVRGFLQLLNRKKEYDKHKEYFNLMISELDRANSILTEFLSMAKNKPVDLKSQNLNQLLQTLFPLIQAGAMNSDKYIEMELAEIPDLLLDEKEVRQLILNLVHNGYQAMAGGKTLKIKTYAEDGEVVLAVEDQGYGIPIEVADKIGTPFFTTKDHGTGLGLSVCYNIVARHNAKILFKTSSAGTTFFVRFAPASLPLPE